MPYCTTCKEEKPTEAFKRRYNGTWYKTCLDCLSLQKHHPKTVVWRQTFAGKYSCIKRKAKERGFEWDLTQEQFQEFWQHPCHYCGSGIPTVGLDRVDSQLGYLYSNLVSCCSICNSMKSTLSQVEFLEHIQKITNHQS